MMLGLAAVVGACVVGFAVEWGAVAAVSAGTRRQAWRELTARPAVETSSRRATLVLGIGYPVVIGSAVCVRLFARELALPGRATGWLVAGFAVALAASAVRAWSVVTLGCLFNRDGLVQESHLLIRDGPYRIVRHPAYAANMGFAIGVGMMLANWASLLVAAIFALVVHAPRIRHEELLLIRRFPDDYPRYACQTGRLLPRLPWHGSHPSSLPDSTRSSEPQAAGHRSCLYVRHLRRCSRDELV